MTTAALPAALPAAPPRRKPYLTIRARPGWIAVNLRELWLFRDLLLSLALRDLKLRYKQTALGVVWVILQPLVAAAILAFVFGKLANLPVDKTSTGRHIPYFLFMFASLLIWNLFAGIITRVSGVLVSNTTLVSKVYFPRLLLPLAGALGVLVDMIVSAAVLLVLQAYADVGFSLHMAAAPLIVLLVMAAALGIGIWAAALCVPYRDVGYILPVVIQSLFLASPIAYSISVVHGRGAFFYQLNPLSGILGFWRWSVLGTPFPPTWTVVYAAAFSLAILLVGALVFRRMERTFADVI